MIQSRTQFVRERVIEKLPTILPEPPPEDQIMNYGLPQKDQKWRPNGLPKEKEFDKLPADEQLILIRKELKIRKEGFFFYNNGRIEYLTGIHYFYLTYWPLPEGLPMFTDADRDFFYFWDECVRDNSCFGMLDIENRRGGKTAKSNCILYEFASKMKNVNCGIQSKTAPDGKGVFNKLKKSWKKLHKAWKPIDTGETNPISSLRFEEPGIKSSKGGSKVYKEVLNSVIDYRSSVEEAYDGEPLHRLHTDEFGKTVEVNAHTRWGIQKFCLINPYASPSIIGKAIYTTTVEEMERKGGKHAKMLWDESDHTKKEANGQTKSGLYRYFKPAYYGLVEYNNQRFVDEYGYSDINGAKAALIIERSSLSGEALYSLIRKMPFSIDESFIISDKSEIFPGHKIYEQQNYNTSIYEPMYIVGNFEWIDDEHTKVEFFPNPNGRWKVAWQLPEELKNNSYIKNGLIAPANTELGLLGVDPFDHKTTVDNRRSNASMHLFRTFDPMMPLRSLCFMVEYINRPPLPEMMFDDMIRTAVYYGMYLLIENQKPGLITYARQRGYSNYIKQTDLAELTKNGTSKKVDGISTSGEYTRELLISHATTYVYESIGKLSEESQNKRGISVHGDYYGFCPFEELMRQWLEFDPEKWTKFDAVVSSSIAILGTKNLKIKSKKHNKVNFAAWFPGRGRR